MPPTLSIVVPAFNEELQIEALLDNLVQSGAEEIIVADGGSPDRTAEITRRRGRVRLLSVPASRAGQMNAGAAAATGDVLLFLHADVRLPPGTLDAVRRAMADPRFLGGNLDIRYSGGGRVARFFNFVNRWRRHIGIFYGDSGIFVRRRVFEEMGGYRPWPLMEDYEFARRLFRNGKLAFLSAPLDVSDRRWRKTGLWKTLFVWLAIQAGYELGVSPHRLAKWYAHVR